MIGNPEPASASSPGVAELIAWLRERVDHDEAVARAANVKQDDPEWWVSPVALGGHGCNTVRSRRDNRPVARVVSLAGDGDDMAGVLDGNAVAAHIARHDPARALREVTLKRRLLAWIELHATMLPIAALADLIADVYPDHPDRASQWNPRRDAP